MSKKAFLISIIALLLTWGTIPKVVRFFETRKTIPE